MTREEKYGEIALNIAIQKDIGINASVMSLVEKGKITDKEAAAVTSSASGIKSGIVRKKKSLLTEESTGNDINEASNITLLDLKTYGRYVDLGPTPKEKNEVIPPIELNKINSTGKAPLHLKSQLEVFEENQAAENKHLEAIKLAEEEEKRKSEEIKTSITSIRSNNDIAESAAIAVATVTSEVIKAQSMTINQKLLMNHQRYALFEGWAAKAGFEGDMGDFLVECFDYYMKTRGMSLVVKQETVQVSV